MIIYYDDVKIHSFQWEPSVLNRDICKPGENQDTSLFLYTEMLHALLHPSVSLLSPSNRCDPQWVPTQSSGLSLGCPRQSDLMKKVLLHSKLAAWQAAPRGHLLTSDPASQQPITTNWYWEGAQTEHYVLAADPPVIKSSVLRQSGDIFSKRSVF